MLRLLHSSTLSHHQIFVISHLSYKDAQVRTVINFKIVALHYLKDPMGFPLDFVSVFHYMYEIINLTIPSPTSTLRWCCTCGCPTSCGPHGSGVLLEGEENDSFVHFLKYFF